MAKTTTTTVKRAVYPIRVTCATFCTFCHATIAAASAHYHVADIGPMCLSCHGLSLIIHDAATDRDYVELTYTIHASRAFRII